MPKREPKNPEIIRQYWREAQRRCRERKKKRTEIDELIREAFSKHEGEHNQ